MTKHEYSTGRDNVSTVYDKTHRKAQQSECSQKGKTKLFIWRLEP